MKQKSTSDLIKGWIDAGISDNAEIASLCDCSAAYVRATKKRMREPGYTSRWRKDRLASDPSLKAKHQKQDRDYKRKRYHEDTRYREVIKARNRAQRRHAKSPTLNGEAISP